MEAAALLAVPAIWLSQQHALAAGTSNPSTIAQHVGVPAYFPPSISYNPDEPWGPTSAGTPPVADGGYHTFGTAGGFAIANVVNGPDYAPDVNYDYSGTLAAEHNAGTSVIGYVDTGYFGTTGLKTRAGYTDVESWRDQIEQDVNAWYAFYGSSMDGIFFDEAQNECGPSNSYAALYAQVSTYVKDAHPAAHTVINPGITVPSCYEDSADTIVTFEGPESSYTASAVALGWTARDPNKIMHIVYGVGSLDLPAVMAESKSWGAGYIDITDEGGTGNPPLYKVLPSYLATEISNAASQAPSTGPSTAPDAPATLDTFDVQFTTAQLSWEAPRDVSAGSGARAYDVYLRAGDGGYHWVSSGTQADWRSTDMSLTGLVPGARYAAYVVARDGAGNVSAPSNIVRWAQDIDTAAEPPSAPGSPVASATTYSTTQLSWLAPGTAQSRSIAPRRGRYPTAFYEVYQDGRQVLQLPADAHRATVTGMNPGTSHTFVIHAVDVAGNVSPASPAVSITTLSFAGSSVASTGLESYTADSVTMSARVYLPFSFVRVFIDVDNNPSSGYSYNGIGADYVIENGRLFSLPTGGKYAPNLVASTPVKTVDYVDTWAVPASLFTGAGTALQISYQAEGFAPTVHTAPISVTKG